MDELLKERYCLARERITQIKTKNSISEPFDVYFAQTAELISYLFELADDIESGKYQKLSFEERKKIHEKLYSEILVGNEGYDISYANPDYCVRKLGEEYGTFLSFLYFEIRGMIAYIFRGEKEDFTVFCELFNEVASLFERGEEDFAKSVVHDFYHDMCDYFCEKNVCLLTDTTDSFFRNIIERALPDHSEVLFEYGEYIGENELKLFSFINSLPEDDIRLISGAFTEGYRKGFELADIDLTNKGSVTVDCFIGFERIMRQIIKDFADMGLSVIIRGVPGTKFLRRSMNRLGYTSVSPNEQYEYDHKDDDEFFFDKAFAKRRLEAMREAFRRHEEAALLYAGPAVFEVFGQKPFSPVDKEYASKLSVEQKRLKVDYTNELGQLTAEFIDPEKRSFTIISFPVPEIGDQFEEIFKRTVTINTLDYEKYSSIQQKLIDALDEGTHVLVKGKGDNRTDITVSLWTLKDPARETIFENCVADVNIPVGEVFTSPVLKGTTGTIHVSGVYLNGLYYKELFVEIKDGMTVDFGCENFDTPEEGRKYIRENVLYEHESLPVGEFAIGTNTEAYMMAKELNIADRLPILIAEKTGPHFALGDTCYSRQEDMVTKNPDGKAIVARENEVSAQRKTDIKKAYFNCHTDITLPFNELEYITVVHPDGTKTDLIRDGYFVLPGTEALNIPLNRKEQKNA